MLPVRVFDASESAAFRVLTALSVPAAERVFEASMESIFDDLNDVFGPDYVATDEEVPDLTLRMRDHLLLVLGADRTYEPRDVIVARALLDREVSGDHVGIRIHLRRMALACLILLDSCAALPPPDARAGPPPATRSSRGCNVPPRSRRP